MTNKLNQEPANSNPTIYWLTVQGKLPEDFKDWFNGILISSELNTKCNSITTLTCKVHDQAELIGIINWLHNMNLTIEQVCLFSSESEMKNV